MASDLSIRTIAGALITDTTELFSGAVQGGTYSGSFRIYNNYDDNPNIAHVFGIEVFLTTNSEARVYNIDDGDPNHHVTAKALLLEDVFSGTLVSGSQEGAAVVDASGTLQSYLTGITESDYDYIFASGAGNFHEYTISFTYPSGVTLITSSGVLGIGIKYKEIIY
jgi:hypothetical protein